MTPPEYERLTALIHAKKTRPEIGRLLEALSVKFGKIHGAPLER